MTKNFYQLVYELVARIPYGRVMTYGQIAIILGRPSAARAVGYALHQLPSGSNIPWQRVINAKGKISPRGAGDLLHEPSLQQILLEEEGLEFDSERKIDLDSYLWEPEHFNHTDYLDNIISSEDEKEFEIGHESQPENHATHP